MRDPTFRVLVGCLLLAGCNATDKPEPAIPADKTLSELYQVLHSDLHQPEDSLVQIKHYYSAAGEANRMQDYYYNDAGKRNLVVAKTADGDTLGLSIFKYDESGKMTERVNFTRENGYTAWASTAEFVYNSDNLEIETYTLRPSRSKSLHTQKLYNSFNQLTEVRFGNDAYVFDYGDNRLIITEKWILLDSPDQPLYTYFYRYDALGRLVGKEVNVNSDAPLREDIFQYDYNETGKLKEEREFETRFGYSLKERKEYVYRTN